MTGQKFAVHHMITAGAERDGAALAALLPILMGRVLVYVEAAAEGRPYIILSAALRVSESPSPDVRDLYFEITVNYDEPT